MAMSGWRLFGFAVFLWNQFVEDAVAPYDVRGRLIARHDPRPEEGAPEIAS